MIANLSGFSSILYRSVTKVRNTTASISENLFIAERREKKIRLYVAKVFKVELGKRSPSTETRAGASRKGQKRILVVVGHKSIGAEFVRIFPVPS